MKLIIGEKEILLEKDEYIEYHDGRSGYNIALDASICGIKTHERVDELLVLLNNARPRQEFTTLLDTLNNVTSFEVLFAMTDFTPLIKRV